MELFLGAAHMNFKIETKRYGRAPFSQYGQPACPGLFRLGSKLPRMECQLPSRWQLHLECPWSKGVTIVEQGHGGTQQITRRVIDKLGMFFFTPINQIAIQI